MLNHRRLNPALITHSALTAAEKHGFSLINEELLSKSEYQDLMVLCEAVLAGRVPGFHLTYTQRHENAGTACRGLCAGLLRPGYLTDEDREKGTDWLLREHSAANLLAFYFRLRELSNTYTLTQAAQRAGVTV